MQIDITLIYMLINAVTMQLLGCVPSFTWTYHMHPFRHRKYCWTYMKLVIIRVVVVNLFMGIVLQQYYGGEQWFALSLQLSGMFAGQFLVLYLIYAGKGNISDRFILVVMAEMYGIVIFCIAFLVIGQITGGETILNLSSKPSRYNLYYLGFDFAICALTTYFMLPILKKLRSGWMPYKKIWLILSVAIFLYGQYSYIYSYGHVYTIVTPLIMGLLVLTGIVIAASIHQRISRKQLFKLNHLLVLQLELINHHFAEMKEQLEITTEIQAEISNGIRAVQQLSAGSEYESSISRYTERFKMYQAESLLPANFNQTVTSYVLYNKQKVCEREGIQTNIQIHDIETDTEAEKQILYILYLLFDIMIEYCRSYEGDGRMIYLTLEQSGEVIMIKVRFSSPVESKRRKRDFIMLKKMVHAGGGFLKTDYKDRMTDMEISI